MFILKKILFATFLLTSASLSAQVQIRGVVVDIDNEPLIGAAIVEKNTTNKTTSDFDGLFSLDCVNNNPILEISYTGFFSQEIRIDSLKEIRVVMEVNLLGLTGLGCGILYN